jgi:N-acetylglutamate synthase-like GNAT family acetyltransferase
VGGRPLRLNAQPLATWERDGLKAALTRAGLPVDGIAEADRLFWRYETTDDVPVGFGGLEVHGEHALLRSVVTLPPLRNRGVGRGIVAMLEAEAELRGCRNIYLLAAGSTDFFGQLGYAPCEPAKVPPTIRDTGEFTALSPAANVMVKRLGN